VAAKYYQFGRQLSVVAAVLQSRLAEILALRFETNEFITMGRDATARPIPADGNLSCGQDRIVEIENYRS
jgi:hypothetical protein